MSQHHNYDQLFGKLPEIETPTGLLGTVLCRIREEEFRKANRRQLTVLLTVTAVFLAAIAYFGRQAVLDLTRSGFFDYISLAISEPSVITGSWKAFIMSLAESLPNLSILIPLAITFGYMESLKVLARTLRIPGPANC